MNLLIILKDKIFKNERYLILFIFLLSVFSRGIAAFYFGDRNLENEWGILIKNLYNHNSLSLLKFDDLFVPNLWMPPVYAYFIYIHVLIFDLGEFLVPSVIFTQIIISSITSIIFYKILLIFFNKNFSILGAIIFCLFPLIIYSTSQISSVTIYLFLSSFIMGAAGFIAGLWADKFDNMATVTNFVIVPLSFLSGTFYSVERLPDILKSLSFYNPFFHMIDGFRYSFINEMDGSINFGIFYLSIISILIWLISYYLYKSGYKIKS